MRHEKLVQEADVEQIAADIFKAQGQELLAKGVALGARCRVSCGSRPKKAVGRIAAREGIAGQRKGKRLSKHLAVHRGADLVSAGVFFQGLVRIDPGRSEIFWQSAGFADVQIPVGIKPRVKNRLDRGSGILGDMHEYHLERGADDHLDPPNACGRAERRTPKPNPADRQIEKVLGNIGRVTGLSFALGVF